MMNPPIEVLDDRAQQGALSHLIRATHRRDRIGIRQARTYLRTELDLDVTIKPGSAPVGTDIVDMHVQFLDFLKRVRAGDYKGANEARKRLVPFGVVVLSLAPRAGRGGR